MKHKIKIIKIALNNYDPNKFMPVYRDTKLANRKQFIAYKLNCFINKQYI